ncbi:MAG: GH3 auxin-responsive promoter family protein, partial [Spirosomaceae bacterium]|nr:GH3 auxin-responsive promoter family protein [Spirosomataceae bacterium]
MKRRSDRIAEFKAFPMEVQDTVFNDLLEKGKNTHYGQKHQ